MRIRGGYDFAVTYGKRGIFVMMAREADNVRYWAAGAIPQPFS